MLRVLRDRAPGAARDIAVVNAGMHYGVNDTQRYQGDLAFSPRHTSGSTASSADAAVDDHAPRSTLSSPAATTGQLWPGASYMHVPLKTGPLICCRNWALKI